MRAKLCNYFSPTPAVLQEQVDITYEMPWVRYINDWVVDSPGILEVSWDQITYNLVPLWWNKCLTITAQKPCDVHLISQATMAGGWLSKCYREGITLMQFQSFWNSGWIYNKRRFNPNAWVQPSSEMYSYHTARHCIEPQACNHHGWWPIACGKSSLICRYCGICPIFSDYVLAIIRQHGTMVNRFIPQNGNFTHADLMYVSMQHGHGQWPV